MYILLVYERELSKNDYLKTLLITIVESIKKLIKKKLSKITYNNNNNNNNNNNSNNNNNFITVSKAVAEGKTALY